MTTGVNRKRTWWKVRHVELGVRATVAAANQDEAQSRAWRQWYRRGPADELESLMRAACPTEDTGEPAEGGTRPEPS